MGGCGEARHVDADLRHHDLRGQITDTGERGQEASAITDRRQGFSHRGIDVSDLQGAPAAIFEGFVASEIVKQQANGAPS